MVKQGIVPIFHPTAQDSEFMSEKGLCLCGRPGKKMVSIENGEAGYLCFDCLTNMLHSISNE